jgi:hypothetical protein
MRDRSRLRFLPLAVFAAALLVTAAPAVGQSCPASPSWVSSPSQPDFSQGPQGPLCNFYQYAWQSFLYLTSPAPGGGGELVFETFPMVSDVVPPSTPPAHPCYDADERQRNKRRFFDVRDAKLDEFQQAGPGGVLIDQNGMVTYYEQFLDPVAASFLQSCHLNIAACATQPAAQSLRFPPASIEIKAAYRPMKEGDPTLAKYYAIPDVTAWNPQADGGKGACETYDFVALVGFHLVYTTAKHLEMVWASFEHDANAPDGPCTGPTTPPRGYETWAFNDPTSTDCDDVNAWTKGTQPPYPVTQAFRNYASGGGSSQNVSTIEALNQSVATVLPSGSIWQNYFLLGAIWTDGTLPAVAAGGTGTANEFGSLHLANATMETFTQFPNPAPTPPPTFPINCFSCHNTSTSEPQPFQVSHALNNASKTATCPYTTELPAACKQTQMGTTQAKAKGAMEATASP